MQGSNLNGAPIETFEERLTRVRTAYMHALNDIVNRVMEEFVLPDDAKRCVQDMAEFTVFLLCIKVASAGQDGPPERAQLMQAYRHMIRDMERSVPEQLLQWARDVAANPELARGA